MVVEMGTENYDSTQDDFQPHTHTGVGENNDELCVASSVWDTDTDYSYRTIPGTGWQENFPSLSILLASRSCVCDSHKPRLFDY